MLEQQQTQFSKFLSYLDQPIILRDSINKSLVFANAEAKKLCRDLTLDGEIDMNLDNLVIKNPEKHQQGIAVVDEESGTK